ncbi:MAG: hypothetical protein GXP45_07770 [bacterium]|nr:hypothetical protein [bacterium]
MRKHLFDYDSVINTQRERIYKQRDNILASEGEDTDSLEEIQKKHQNFIDEKIKEIEGDIQSIFEKQIDNAKKLKQDTTEFLANIQKEMNIQFDSKTYQNLKESSFDEIKKLLSVYVRNQLRKKTEEADTEQLYKVIKDIYLHYIDTLWIEHIDEMQYLRDKVGLMGYAQLDPLIIYKKEAYEKFQQLLYRLKFDTTASLLNVDFKALTEQENMKKNTIQIGSKADETYLKILQELAGTPNVQEIIKQEEGPQDPRKAIFEDQTDVEVFEIGNDNNNGVINTNKHKKVRPNDPCPCGSGKKYKKCCGIKT